MPSTVTIDWYLALSIILFTLGALGVLLSRNAIIIFMSVELMLNSANLLFVAFSRYLSDLLACGLNVFHLFLICAFLVWLLYRVSTESDHYPFAHFFPPD